MNFKSINQFAVVINSLSGNLLPLSDEKSEYSWRWRMYAIVFWIMEIVYLFLSIVALFLVSTADGLQNGTVNLVVIIEGMVISLYMNCRRNKYKKFINVMNEILNNSDQDKIQACIKRTTHPINNVLRIYTLAVVSAVFVWMALIFIKAMEQDQFSFADFRVPMFFPGNPFTTSMFVYGVMFQVIGATMAIAKKSSIDVYVIHMITLVTSQYHYISDELEDIFELKQDDNNFETKRFSEEKALKDKIRVYNLKRLIQHHGLVAQASKMLKNLLSLNVAVTYVNCIFRFCFLAFMLITMPSPIFEKCLIVMYTCGSMIQIFILCSCTEALLEASINVTNNAFYKEWYECDLYSQRIYANMMISNNLECRLTAFGTVDMTLKTFMTILRQSYSACLFLIKLNT